MDYQLTIDISAILRIRPCGDSFRPNLLVTIGDRKFVLPIDQSSTNYNMLISELCKKLSKEPESETEAESEQAKTVRSEGKDSG